MTEFAFPVSLVHTANLSTVTAFNEGAERPVYTADSHHPNWNGILAGLQSGDPNVWSLFDVGPGLARTFQQVTDRFSWDGVNVLFDGDPIHSVFADILARAMREGNAENYVPLAKFGEKLASNPDEHSREQAYAWLASHEFQITPDGDVVGYKSVTVQPDGTYLSGYASQVADKPSGFVNGVAVPPLSRIPQKDGDVVTLPRAEVHHDPSKPCERGLHVGTHKYFSGFGQHTLMVLVNPMDVVSVPTDSRGAKVRVCRYKIVGLVDKPSTGTVLRDETKATTWTPDVSVRV